MDDRTDRVATGPPGAARSASAIDGVPSARSYQPALQQPRNAIGSVARDSLRAATSFIVSIGTRFPRQRIWSSPVA